MAEESLYDRVICRFLTFVRDDPGVPAKVAYEMQALLSKTRNPTVAELTAVLSVDPTKETADGLG